MNIIHSFKNAFNYSGRARRKEFGIFLLCYVVLKLAIKVIDSIQGLSEAVTLGIYGIELLILLCFFVVYVSLITRRLHDLGHSGKWQILYWCVTLVMISGVYYASDVGIVSSHLGFIIVALVIGYAPLFYLLFKDGQPHANRYGESPKYPSEPNG